jgi:transposase-like protein
VRFFTTYEKVRQDAGIVSQAAVVAVTVRDMGETSVLDLRSRRRETEAFWLEVLPQPLTTWPERCAAVISDAHEGMRGALPEQRRCCRQAWST